MPSRRRLLQMLGAVAAAGAGGWALLSGGRANAYYRAPLRPFRRRALLQSERRAAEGTRRVPQMAAGRSRRGVAEQLSQPVPGGPSAGALRRRGAAHHLRRARDVPDPDARQEPADRSRLGGARQPGLVRRAQAREPAGHRLRRPAAIDAVLVTHNHYDHMDVDTIGRLWQRFRPRIVTPLGNDAILKSSVPGLAATAVDWGDVVDLGRRPRGARGADAALVGARHRRPHARAVGELRRARPARARSTASATAASATARRSPRVRQAPSGPRAGAAADRRLRAALVHAQQPHEPGGGRARRCGCRAPRRALRPPLGHVPPDQRGRRAAADGPGRGARRAATSRPNASPALRPGEVRVVT